MIPCQVPGRVRTALLGMLLLPLTGCAALTSLSGIPAIPAHRVPPELLAAVRQADLEEISLTRLRQDPPPVYQLGPGDILGVYIENVLGDPEELPPYHIPDDPSRPPAIGFPVPVREDGTILLPIIPPLNVEGLTLVQATALIQRAYTVDREILQPGQDQILATLIQRRVQRVLVVREESGGMIGVTKRGTGHILDMPAYENDVLHALNMTGGMPGLDARNEIYIYRGVFQTAEERDRIIAELRACEDPCGCKLPLPPDPTVTVIPLRYHPAAPPVFSQEDIILRTGDIVMIKARDNEIFYTGGLLGGGEILLPRDRDLDIMGAIALAGGPFGGGPGLSMLGGRGGGGGGFGGGRAGGIVPPSRAIILREVCGGQIPIRVDLNRALVDPGQRILIQPNDFVILEYTCDEQILNAAFNLVQFNFLFNGFRRGGF